MANKGQVCELSPGWKIDMSEHIPKIHKGGKIECSCGGFDVSPRWDDTPADRRDRKLAFRAHVVKARAEERAAAEAKIKDDNAKRVWEERKAALRGAKNRPAKKTAARWKRLIHRSWTWTRTLYIPGDLERAFADCWEEENVPKSYLNQGRGTLQNLFFRSTGTGIFRRNILVTEINNRDAMIAATVVQWLGTNCGFCFLRRVLEKCGHRICDAPREQEGDWKPKHVAIHLSAQELAVLRAFSKRLVEHSVGQLQSATGMTRPETEQVFEVLCKLGFCQWSQRAPAGKEYRKKRLCSLTKLGQTVCQSWNVKEFKDGGGAELFCMIPQGELRKLQRSYREVIFHGVTGEEVRPADVPRRSFFAKGLQAV